MSWWPVKVCPLPGPSMLPRKGQSGQEKKKSYCKTSFTCSILKTCTEKELYSMRGLEDGFKNGHLIRKRLRWHPTSFLLKPAENRVDWLHLPEWGVREAQQVMWKQRDNWEERNIREVPVNIYSLSTQNMRMHHRPREHVGIQPVSLHQQLKCIN